MDDHLQSEFLLAAHNYMTSDDRAISAQGFGYMLGIRAALVVLSNDYEMQRRLVQITDAAIYARYYLRTLPAPEAV